MSKKFDIVTASQEDYPQDTILGESLRKGHNEKQDYVLDFHADNNNSLASIYNKAIQNTEADYLILCHDDISIEDNRWDDKIVEAIGPDSEFAICGLAGNSKCRFQDKNLWHLMSPPKMSPHDNSLSGAVAHYTGRGEVECFMTNFGPTPKRVILLDGLFLALNVKKVREVGLTFDQSNPAKFHFYDLDFCLQANKLGLKMTTWPIWVVHRSHGLSDINNEEWNAANDWFAKKWKRA